ncbi:MAG TPA: hypothetical protein DCP92_05095 [Nitrospiraceae bacterium]|nr:hypothetical protein [Nitrospiraceae bacterium]
MRLFSKLFNSRRSRRDLHVLATDLCYSLEDLRHLWFNSCYEAFNVEAGEGVVKYLNDNLVGEADYAMRAYQLYLVSGFLAEHSYMEPSMTKEFISVLRQQILGTHLDECLLYYGRYSETNEGQRLSHFCKDITKHITGGETPMTESLLLLSRCFPILFNVTHMWVAKAFDDHETVHKLEDNFKKTYERTVTEWNDKALPILYEFYEDENQAKS